jgi:hypothetical protein
LGKKVKRRIGMVSNKFKSLGFILADKFQKLEIKKDVLESCVFLVLSDGAQTWSLIQKEKRMPQTCQQKMEQILQVVWCDRVTNAELRQRTNMTDTVSVAHSLKCK